MVSSIIYSAVFIALFIGGLLALIMSAVIVAALIKHRKDKAPLLMFFLNKEAAVRELSKFIYPAVLLVLTSIFTVGQKFLTYYSSLYLLSLAFYLIAYVLGISALVSIIIINYSWFKRFRRFI